MKTGTNIIRIVLDILGALILIFCIVYISRFRTMSTLQKHSSYDDGYNLYSIDIKYNYSIDDIINSGYQDTQGFVDAVIKESLPLLPIHMELPNYGCSAFRTETADGHMLMGRNYDFKLDTSALMVRCEPKDGYKSIAFAALNNVGADDAGGSLKNKMACLTAPFICLDGVNEKGVSIAVLTLPSEPTIHNTGKPKLATSLLIRLVLDRAATTQEALDLISQYDMLSANGRDYHFFISDASGNSVVVEFDCESEGREMVVTPTQAVTNFFMMYTEKVLPNQKNGIYGAGKERWESIMNVLTENEGKVDREVAWAALRSAAQDPNPEDVTSNTQWSIVFDNNDGTAEISLRRRFEDRYSFSID